MSVISLRDSPRNDPYDTFTACDCYCRHSLPLDFEARLSQLYICICNLDHGPFGRLDISSVSYGTGSTLEMPRGTVRRCTSGELPCTWTSTKPIIVWIARRVPVNILSELYGSWTGRSSTEHYWYHDQLGNPEGRTSRCHLEVPTPHPPLPLSDFKASMMQ